MALASGRKGLAMQIAIREQRLRCCVERPGDRISYPIIGAAGSRNSRVVCQTAGTRTSIVPRSVRGERFSAFRRSSLPGPGDRGAGLVGLIGGPCDANG